MVKALILFGGGFFTGLYGAAVGGGGLLSLPLLVLTGFPTHLAIGTNRFAAVILEAVSTLRFYREGKLLALHLKLALGIGALAALGSVFGAALVLELEEWIVNIAVAVLLFAIMVFLLSRKVQDEKPRPITIGRAILILLSALLIGIYGGFVGTGAGTCVSVVLIGLGFSVVDSAAISRLSGMIWSFSAAVVFAFNDAIDYGNGLILAAGFAFGGWIGAGLGARKGNRYIRLLMIAVVLATIGKLVFEALR